ncbi:MAG: T9SS type A sorting domain-containing protein, partial [Ignavibacteria bacterium]|nr:T9SS type A sorting domain-containing protein [Ignavibacteria bacterium]
YGDSDPIAGGLFRTTNGGINWEKRDSGIPANSYPDKIYFYNSRIGFAYQSGDPNSYKTTDGGLSWSVSFSGGFGKLFFRDSLNGYRSSQGFYRTSNGGLNWSKDSVPSAKGNVYTRKWITDFSLVNNDTIYAAGASVQFLTNFIYKSLIYKTTNGGINWGYQIPDTSYGSAWHDEIFAIRNNIWAYTTYNNRGIYSSTGGDTTIYVKVNNNSNELPTDFELGQNYPNPFNKLTIIKYQLSIKAGVLIKIFDITGKEITVLNEGKKLPGNYEIRFDAGSLGSGIYFYQLIADEKVIQTRKMMLLK